MKPSSLLLIDDDRHVLESMADWLREKGFAVTTAMTCAETRERLAEKNFELVLADIRLPDGDGFEILQDCRRLPQIPAVILLTGYGTVETAVEALRAGAFDLLTKPLIDEELEMSINRALAQRRVIEENKRLKAQLDRRFGLGTVVGKDPRMMRVFDLVERIADTRATVLITGESGTGKSLIARAIHRHSSRRDGPFVEIACGALPDTLLESELFGHVAGSFTGALGEKIGKFRLADRGTIFLDEIGTSSPGLQVKLLRVLQDFEFEPVGGTKTMRVDARVVLATNENLAQAVAEGRFRQDLYYRINVINLELPSLRERVSDVRLLAQHFLETICEETGKIIRGFTDECLAALDSYPWPGNVRELQNVVERAVLLSRGDCIAVDDLPPSFTSGTLPIAAGHANLRGLKQSLAAPERQIILDVLRANNWNRNASADALGINRTTLYKKMKKLGLDHPEFSGPSKPR